MRTRLRRSIPIVLLTALTAGVLSTAPASAAPGAVSVSNGDLAAPCTTPRAICRFEPLGKPGIEVVDSPNAKYGDGYLRLSTPTADDRASVAQIGDGVLTVGDLLKNPLSYETYVEVPSGVAAPSFNIGVLSKRVRNTDGSLQFTTLVWEPTYTGAAITPGTWQAWQPSAATKGWWATRTLDDGTVNRYGFTNYQASFQQAVAGVGEDAIVTNIGVNQGRGPAGLVAGVDAVSYNGQTLDFENPVTATAITPVSGTPQSATAGSPFPTRLAARVTGGIKKPGTPVPGTPVVYRVVSGSATFPGGAAGTSVVTGADGVATAPVLTAGATPGPVTVTATAGSGASTEAVVSTTFTTTVTAPPPAVSADLAVAVSVPATAKPGARVTATVTVTNRGAAAATAVRTTVTLTNGLLVVSAPGSAGPAAGTQVTFVDGTLAPGATATHTVSMVGARTGSAAVRAVVTATTADPNPLNNTATGTVVVR